MSVFSLNSHQLGELGKPLGDHLVESNPRLAAPINLEEANADPVWRVPPLTQLMIISAGKVPKHQAIDSAQLLKPHKKGPAKKKKKKRLHDKVHSVTVNPILCA